MTGPEHYAAGEKALRTASELAEPGVLVTLALAHFVAACAAAIFDGNNEAAIPITFGINPAPVPADQ